MRGAGGRRDQPEQQQRPDGLRALGGDDRERDQEARAEHPDPDAARTASSESSVERSSGRNATTTATLTARPTSAATSAWPDPSSKIEPNSVLVAAIPLPPWGPVASSVISSTPIPRIHANTIPITVSSAAPRLPERRHPQRDDDRQREQPDADVEPEHCGADRADERDVAERVAGEHLGAQHDQPSDRPARERDERPGEVRVADELVREHR